MVSPVHDVKTLARRPRQRRARPSAGATTHKTTASCPHPVPIVANGIYVLAIMSLGCLPARHGHDGVYVVVESPRGSRVKLKLDPALDAFVLSRTLALGVRYPFDWGFIPSTRAPDGDPVDALVLHEAATYPGVVIACEPIGVVRCSQRRPDGSGRERNDRVIAVPEAAPRLEGVRDAHDISERTRQEIEQFFQLAILLTGKDASFEGWDGREAAERLIEEGIRVARQARAA